MSIITMEIYQHGNRYSLQGLSEKEMQILLAGVENVYQGLMSQSGTDSESYSNRKAAHHLKEILTQKHNNESVEL